MTQFKAGDRVYLKVPTEVAGTVLAITEQGTIDVAWEHPGMEEPFNMDYSYSEVGKLRSFQWSRWSGAHNEIHDVRRIKFGAAHVVFYGVGGIILRAVRVENVNEMVEVL